MKKIIFAIAIILVALNCMGQRRHYVHVRPSYYHYYLMGYYGMSDGVATIANEMDAKCDIRTDLIDTSIITEYENFDIQVFPIKGYNKTYGSLDLPNWVKLSIYQDIQSGKEVTNFLANQGYVKGGGFGNEYKVVIKNGNETYEKKIRGEGGNIIPIKIGEFNGFIQRNILTQDDIFTITMYNCSTHDEEQLVYEYLVKNQDRLGMKVKSRKYNKIKGLCSKEGIEVEYYLLDVWKDQVKQIDNMIRESKVNSLN